MSNDVRQHSVQLHRETNGWTIRHRDPKAPQETLRYVFATAGEMVDWLIVNFIGQGNSAGIGIADNGDFVVQRKK